MRLICVLCLLFLSCTSEGLSINLLPMYGGVNKSEREAVADSTYVRQVVKKCGSRDQAFIEAIDVAWNYYYNHDMATAMKRFNQAWLLDSTKGEVYWGFGSILATTKAPIDSSLKYLYIAQTKLPENERLKSSIATTNGDHALFLKQNNDENWKMYATKMNEIYESISTRRQEDCDLFMRWWEYSLLLDDPSRIKDINTILEETGVMPHNRDWFDDLKKRTTDANVDF